MHALTFIFRLVREGGQAPGGCRFVSFGLTICNPLGHTCFNSRGLLNSRPLCLLFKARIHIHVPFSWGEFYYFQFYKLKSFRICTETCGISVANIEKKTSRKHMSNRPKRPGSSSSTSSSSDQISRAPSRQARQYGEASSSSQAGMPSGYNRVRVEDLLNAEASSSSRSKSSNRVGDDKRKKGGASSSAGGSEVMCDVPHCKRKFPTLDSLKAHQKRSHAPPTAYVCEHCKSSFSTPPNLNKHVSQQFLFKIAPSWKKLT